MILVNLKAYREGTGRNSAEMARKAEKAANKTDERVVIAPPPQDIRPVSEHVETFAQHISPVEPGSHTSRITAEGVKQAGATGTILNHSERRIPHEEIRRCLERADEAGLETVVSAKNPAEVEKLSSMKPDYIAYEPPELIGGEKAVSDAQPDLVREAVEKTAESVKTLTGAGIQTGEDVERCRELGCSGILVASAVVKSEKPKRRIERLCEGL
jgi:triosephosphate isomerase